MASRIEYLSVTFLEDTMIGAMLFAAGSAVSLPKDVARGLGRSVYINGAGSAATAVVPGGGSGISTLTSALDYGIADLPNGNGPLNTALANQTAATNAVATTAASATASANSALAAAAAATTTASSATTAATAASSAAATALAAANGAATVAGGAETDAVAAQASADAAAALAATKMNNAIAWPAATNTSPTLVTDTVLTGAFAGIICVVNVSAGVTTLSPAINGITSTKFNDVWVQGFGGGVGWSILAGPTFLGIFATTGALPAAAGNAGYTAVVGSAAPYTYYVCDGSAWNAGGANGAGYKATSTTSLATAGSGSKAFTTQAGLAYSAGARIRATSTGTSEWMEGIVSAYSGTTLTVTMDLNSGTGTHADWNINVAGNTGRVGFAVAQITTNKTFAAADDGKPFEVTTAVTLTFPVGMGWLQGISIKLPATGTVTFAGDGTSLINGVTTSTTRVIGAGQRLVAVVPAFAANSFDVTGQ